MEQAIANRLMAKNAHNYTGNLLNSIAVVLLAAPKTHCPPKTIYLSSRDGHIAKAIQPKMTEPYYYEWREGFRRTHDYDYRQSGFGPRVETDETYASKGAEEWAQRLPPLKHNSENVFEIHVGYNVEYMQWVLDFWGAGKDSTGFWKTRQFAIKQMRHFFHQLSV